MWQQNVKHCSSGDSKFGAMIILWGLRTELMKATLLYQRIVTSPTSLISKRTQHFHRKTQLSLNNFFFLPSKEQRAISVRNHVVSFLAEVDFSLVSMSPSVKMPSCIARHTPFLIAGAKLLATATLCHVFLWFLCNFLDQRHVREVVSDWPCKA